MPTNSGNHKQNAVNVREMIEEKRNSRNISNITEKLIPTILFIIASISVLTTIGIIYTLLSEAIEFFKIVPIWEFLLELCSSQ